MGAPRAGTSDIDASGGRPGEALSGLERLRRGLASVGPSVPFNDALQMHLLEVEPGAATRAVTVPPWLDDLLDHAVIGGVAVAADSSLGSALLTLLPAGMLCVSAQLRVDMVQQLRSGRPHLTCRARAVHHGDGMGLVQGEVLDTDGNTVAHASLWATVVPVPAAQSSVAAFDQAVVPGVAVDGARGLFSLPVVAMFGLRTERPAPGSTRVFVPPNAMLTNSLGWMHGGAIAVFGDLAAAAAVEDLLDDAPARPLALTVDYLRPLPMTGDVEIVAHTTHHSRRLAIVDVTVMDPDGRTTARMTRTTQLPA